MSPLEIGEVPELVGLPTGPVSVEVCPAEEVMDAYLANIVYQQSTREDTRSYSRRACSCFIVLLVQQHRVNDMYHSIVHQYI
jgi:hypothetical protein